MRLALKGLFTWLCESPGEEDKLSSLGQDTTEHVWDTARSGAAMPLGSLVECTVDLHRADQREG